MFTRHTVHTHTHTHSKFLLGPNREEDYTLRQSPNLVQISWERAHSLRVMSVCLASAASLDTLKHTRTYRKEKKKKNFEGSQVNANKTDEQLEVPQQRGEFVFSTL